MNASAAAAAPAPPLLRLRGVSRNFGGIKAVDGVDLDVPAGERRAILGPNGAGKTTLFNLISGDMATTGGAIEFMGIDVTRSTPQARARLGIGRTYQKTRLFLGLTVEDNIFLAIRGATGGHLRPFTYPKRDGAVRERARALAGQVGLGGREGALVGALSHGEQRQLEVAMAQASSPTLVMLDEPASGLSRGERSVLTELLLELDQSVTLILIEHDMDVALRVAERVTIMHEGRVIIEGSPDDIRADQTVHDLYLGRSGHGG